MPQNKLLFDQNSQLHPISIRPFKQKGKKMKSEKQERGRKKDLQVQQPLRLAPSSLHVKIPSMINVISRAT